MKNTGLIIICIFFSSMTLFGQENGIQFEKNLNWEEILAKAQKENKPILLDCYASWCGPCKEMEKEVFPLPNVGDYVNKKFIPVQVQIDSTKNDDERTKNWRAIAKKISSDYNITAFPAFILIAPDGHPLHKEYGYFPPKEFLEILEIVNDPSGQYYTTIAKYQKGQLDYSKFPDLINQTRRLGDKRLSLEIADIYKNKYLNKVGEKVLLEKQNVDFSIRNRSLFSSNDRIFHIAYNNPKSIDSINPFFSKDFVNYIVTKEEIDDRIWQDGKLINHNPEWNIFENNIARKFKKLDSKGVVLEAQLAFYRKMGDWQKFANYREKKINNAKLALGGGFDGDAWLINQDAWDIFLKCTDKKVLSQALSWMDISIDLATKGDDRVLFAYYDTKASLLYKLGRKQEAISTEMQAIEISKSKGEAYDSYSEVIENMKKDKPIWNAKWDNL